MSLFVYRLNDKIHHSVEKILHKIEGFHQRTAAKPYDLIEKSERLKPITRSIRSATEGLIGKFYRGIRDLNEMSHQLSENYFNLIGLQR